MNTNMGRHQVSYEAGAPRLPRRELLESRSWMIEDGRRITKKLLVVVLILLTAMAISFEHRSDSYSLVSASSLEECIDSGGAPFVTKENKLDCRVGGRR